ncbi:MAG: N-acetylmuramic acid 6-phosphate etherase [Streptosporangiales bacterium]|nr:N-acetylmuramic acid 6-phosphate etherase [Streptosporangiales bacterium]
MSTTGDHAAPVERVEVPTERRNPRTTHIDTRPTLEVARLINAEDAQVPAAVGRVLPDIARAADIALDALRGGHRVHYFGAGASGRIAVMDAAELPPTYGVRPDQVVAHHAGGLSALVRPLEDVEDDEEAGLRDAADVRRADVALGLAASGRTPYVVGALRAARAAGATAVLVSANPWSAFGREVDLHIAVDTGPEVIAGSTRMKAATAQKLVLNTFSTTLMVRLGRTYSNLMVNLSAVNAKLRGRGVTILVEATGMESAACAAALERAGGDTRVALVSLLCQVSVERAAAAVDQAGGHIRDAMDSLSRP